MQAGMFQLSSNDYVKGLVVAVGAAIFTSIVAVLGSVITAPGFDVFSVDWGSVGHMLVNVSIVSGFGGFTGYIGKQFVSDKSGAVFGSFAGGGGK